MGRTTKRLRAVARGAVGAALLIGLFLMHGAAMGSNGCSGGGVAGTGAAGTSAAPMAEAGMIRAAHHPAMEPAAPSRPIALTRVQVGSPGLGVLCATTPLRNTMAFTPPLGVLVAVLGFVALGIGYGVLSGARGLRGPPLAGARLLIRVCVSRT